MISAWPQSLIFTFFIIETIFEIIINEDLGFEFLLLII